MDVKRHAVIVPSDDGGLLLAVGEVGIDVPSKSGNPSHGRAGRFAGRLGSKSKKPKPGQSQGTVSTTPAEIARRNDAVRDAAREFETFNQQDVDEWLKGRTTRELTSDERAAFARDVRAQQLTDLVDILDNIHRGTLRNRRFVRVQAPKGYTRKTLGGLSDLEMASVVLRLRARGWDDKAVESFKKTVPEHAKASVEGLAELELPEYPW